MLRAVSYNLTTLRSSVHFMHQTLKTQRKAKSNELITLWQMFDDVVSYEEDPSGTTAGIAAISTKYNDEWKAYEAGRRIIGQATKGRLKVYASRCEKILKTLFLYHVAKMQPNGLSVEEVMNSVMEWSDHDKGQKADIKDNLDHYEVLLDELAKELPQVKKVGQELRLHAGRRRHRCQGTVPEGPQPGREQSGPATRCMEPASRAGRLGDQDLAPDDGPGSRARSRSSVGSLPPNRRMFEVEWHGRTIKGRVYMRDLLDIASKGQALPPLNTADTDHDFAVFISNRPCGDKVTDLAKKVERSPHPLLDVPPN